MSNWLQGNKVKLTCSFKGREIEFQSIGRELFEVLPLVMRSVHAPQTLTVPIACRAPAHRVLRRSAEQTSGATQRFLKDLGDEAVVENRITMQGRQMSMIIGKAASSSS